MRDIKEYKAPRAQVTEFECADVITASMQARDLYDTPNGAGVSGKYVKAGSVMSWNDIKDGN